MAAAGSLGVFLSAGCSHATDGGKSAPSSASPAHGPVPVPQGAIGRSPAGVTTRVDVPADSTEEQYFQACHAAKLWMDGQPGARDSLFEPYLAMVQASASGTPGTWNLPWVKLTPARQAGVIVAARAAVAQQCG